MDRRRGEGATPEHVSDWWSRLAEGERQRHVDRFTKPEAPNDESIREQARKFGSLDGIEGWARDNVNRSLLEWDIVDTKRQRDALPGNKGPGEEYAAEGQARNHERARLRERLEELEKLRGQLGAEEGKPPKQPLLYDPATGQRRNRQRAGRPHLRHVPPNRFCKNFRNDTEFFEGLGEDPTKDPNIKHLSGYSPTEEKSLDIFGMKFPLGFGAGTHTEYMNEGTQSQDQLADVVVGKAG